MEQMTAKELAALLGVDYDRNAFSQLEEKWVETFFADSQRFFTELEQYSEEERYPLALRIYLEIAATRTVATYRKHRISQKVYLDTMADLAIWTENCVRDTGIYGLREYRWVQHHLKLELFKLGSLRFEPIRLEKAIDSGEIHIPAGAEVLNVYVPQGEPLSYEACQDSYKQAVKFYGINRFVCSSWLLSPQLQRVLSETTNITRFQSDFTIYEIHKDDRQCEERIFGKLLDNPAGYPENSSLQKGVKELLLEGQKPGIASGVFLMPAVPFQVDGSRQYRLMEQMDYIRLVGTENEERGAKVLLQELKAFGLDGWTEQFDYHGYTMEEATFEVLTPYRKSYTVTGYGLTGNANLEAELYYAETAEEINLAFVRGKLVLINHPAKVAIYKSLVKAGAVGFLTISGTPFDELDKTDLETRAIRPDRHLTDDTVKIPGATIRYLDAVELLERGAEKVCLTIKQTEGVYQGKNVVAEIPGTELSEEILVFMAHYDSVPFSRGAYDNTAGCAVIMEMCRYFAMNPPRRTVRFVWFSGEEIGLVGSREYIKQHEAEHEKIKLGLNVDLAGHIIGSNSICVTGDISILHAVTAFAKEKGYPAAFAQKVGSTDSSSFADVGIPTIWLYRNGYGGHNRLDTLDRISPISLRETADFFCKLGVWVDGAAVFPFPRKMPQNMKEDLDKYFGRSQ